MNYEAYDANVVHSLRLLPGSHFLYTYDGDLVPFNVANDGTVSYDASLEGPLSGQGTIALAVNGWSIAIDATALGNSYSALDDQSCDSSQTLPVRLLAGTHSFYKEGTTYYFTVAADGTVDYDQAMDGILEGRGTRKLTLLQMQ
jgi:hypothetical protein